MAKLDIAERRLPQDGRIKLRLGKGREMDFRVSTIPVLFGEKVVLRLLDKGALQLDMTKLGFEETALNDLKQAIHKPVGMILVTGPTGSGKTTTLYSVLTELNKESENIITAEDPIEYNFMGINQVQMHEEIGLKPEHVEVLARTRDWLRYEVPDRYIRRDARGHYKGQKQIWFLLRLVGGDWNLNLRATDHPEFDAWRWHDYWVPLDMVIEFKRDVYLRALQELAAYLPPLPGRPDERNGRGGNRFLRRTRPPAGGGREAPRPTRPLPPQLGLPTHAELPPGASRAAPPGAVLRPGAKPGPTTD